MTLTVKRLNRGGDRDSLAVDEGRRLRDVRCGQHQMFAALYYPFDKPRRWTIPVASARWVLVYLRHWASKGVARRNRGLRHWRRQYSDEHQELSTALQYELPVLVVNLNTAIWGW